MIEERKIVLSLGTNLGKRFKNLKNAIEKLQQIVGKIDAISSLYESKSWGFEAADFLNCNVLLTTKKSILDVFHLCQTIENELGRAKKNSTFYESRLIDIDIVSYENAIFESPDLHIPHRLMHERKFVLEPMIEVAPNWIHPILKCNAQQLLDRCEDATSLKKVAPAEVFNIQLETVNYICIEGVIGAGKTSLARLLSGDFNGNLILERFADNAFLPKFYEEPARYAFQLEMSFLADRYKQLHEDIAQLNLFNDFVVADYHIFKSLIFAQITLQNDEMKLYKNLFDIIYKEVPKPNLYVYLYQNTENLIKNIKKRGRDFEQNIESTYLENLQKGYLDFLKTQSELKTLIIDVSELNFVDRTEDYFYILEQIHEALH